MEQAGTEYRVYVMLSDSLKLQGEFTYEGWIANVVCVVSVSQEGEGKMAPQSSPSQRTQASVKCQRKTSSMSSLT